MSRLSQEELRKQFEQDVNRIKNITKDENMFLVYCIGVQRGYMHSLEREMKGIDKVAERMRQVISGGKGHDCAEQR